VEGAGKVPWALARIRVAVGFFIRGKNGGLIGRSLAQSGITGPPVWAGRAAWEGRAAISPAEVAAAVAPSTAEVPVTVAVGRTSARRRAPTNNRPLDRQCAR